MRIRRGLSVRKIGDDYVVEWDCQDVGILITLNETSYYLWSKLQTRISFTLNDMVKILTEEYDVNADVAQNDCETLLESWKNSNLIELL